MKKFDRFTASMNKWFSNNQLNYHGLNAFLGGYGVGGRTSDMSLLISSGFSGAELLAYLSFCERAEFVDTKIYMPLIWLSEREATISVAVHLHRLMLGVYWLAGKLGCEQLVAKKLACASVFHDIGYNWIENSDRTWLSDIGQISSSDEHGKLGSDFLKNTRGVDCELLADISLFHHERWDGKGPQGLQGSAIPFAAQLVGLIHFFEENTQGDSKGKRQFHPENELLDMILGVRSSWFDPKIISVLACNWEEFLDVMCCNDFILPWVEVSSGFTVSADDVLVDFSRLFNR